MFIIGDCSIHWVWNSGGFKAIMQHSDSAASKERFHQDAGK